MAWRTIYPSHEWAEIQPQSFATSTLGDDWEASRPGRFSPRQITLVPLSSRPDGPHIVRIFQNFFFLHSPVRNLVTTLTELCWLLLKLCVCRQSTSKVRGEKCEILGSHSGAVEVSVLLGCDAASLG